MGSSILRLIKKRIILLDGGMGTELIRHGFPQGACPESWNLEKPELIIKIYKSYFDAGSDAVLTNSFGGNKIKLSSYGLDDKCYEINSTAAYLAQECRPKGKFIGGSMGPTGQFLKPQGNFTENGFEDAYAEQAMALSEGKADFLLIETQYDLREALCALKAARKSCDLPVFVTLTFNKNPRGYFTIMGDSVYKCIKELESCSVPAIGANCTLDSEQMVGLVKDMRKYTSLPLIAQANAGQPSLSSDGKVIYSQPLEDYIRFIPAMIENGANIIGGCCGTNPDYIRQMASIIKNNP